ncbi:hypothetical protein BGZ76_007513 [Entomortierella beljakovae]|nr:hypothetical protein BGZ76_007513 [Entomortierella beljakovae]
MSCISTQCTPISNQFITVQGCVGEIGSDVSTYQCDQFGPLESTGSCEEYLGVLLGFNSFPAEDFICTPLQPAPSETAVPTGAPSGTTTAAPTTTGGPTTTLTPTSTKAGNSTSTSTRAAPTATTTKSGSGSTKASLILVVMLTIPALLMV